MLISFYLFIYFNLTENGNSAEKQKRKAKGSKALFKARTAWLPKQV